MWPKNELGDSSTMRNTILISLSLAGAVALSGCQSTGFGLPSLRSAPKAQSTATPQLTANAAPATRAAPPTGIDGRWIPTDEGARGVYVAEFRKGVFVSRPPNNGDALARGRYTVKSEKEVELSFIGAVSKRSVNATCERKSADTLFCVPNSGSPFNLRRTG